MMNRKFWNNIWIPARVLLGGLLAIIWVFSGFIAIAWISSMPLPAFAILVLWFASLLYIAHSLGQSYVYGKAPQAQIVNYYYFSFHQDFMRSGISHDAFIDYLADNRFHKDRIMNVTSPVLVTDNLKFFREALDHYEEFIEVISDEISSLAEYGFPICGLFNGSPSNVKEHCLAFDEFVKNDLIVRIAELSDCLLESGKLLSAINNRLAGYES